MLTATPAGDSRTGFSAGPADAVASDSEGEGNVAETSVASQRPPFNAAVLDLGVESFSVQQEWDAAIQNAQMVARIGAEAEQIKNSSLSDREKEVASQQYLAMAKCAHYLGGVAQDSVRKALQQWEEAADGTTQPTVTVRETLIPLNSFTKEFWGKPFVHLFPRTDCMERDCNRTPGSLGRNDRLRGKAWGKVLLSRVDFRGWARSKQFIACLFNIFYRREQYGSIKKVVLYDPLFQQNRKALAGLSAQKILLAAAEAGDAPGAREILCKANLDKDLGHLVKMIHTVTRNIDWSDAARTATRIKFTALRIWSGMSVIFFTLNPSERSSGLTLKFCGPYTEETRNFSLDLSEEEMV